MHAALERGLFRWWPRTGGPALEVSWPAWSVGIELNLHTGDYRNTIVWLRVMLLLFQIHIPIGWLKREYDVGDEPQWGLMLSREFGIVWHWGEAYRQWDWMFHTILLRKCYLSKSGEWKVEGGSYSEYKETRDDWWTETHPYSYTLLSGEVQHRQATIHQERWERGRHILSRFGWPSRVEHSIYVDFDGEVGEETGSWKGGCVGCGYTMREGETPLEALRRMEAERKF